MTVFIIAEAGSSHDNDLQKAYRLIEAAKECGADAVKFQWTSNAGKMADRRGLDLKTAGTMYETYLEKPVSWLESLKAHADKVGIEFMCTVYLIEDISTIAPFVKRFKVSAFESHDAQFIAAHLKGPALKGPWNGHDVIISLNPGKYVPMHLDAPACVKTLHCISLYPTDPALLRLGPSMLLHDGFSDHTANVLTGAAAVAAGASIVEAHIRLSSTSPENPDYPHSLVADSENPEFAFSKYVQNIRTVERML